MNQTPRGTASSSDINLPKSQIQPDFQWQDFLARREDLYANAKYDILLKWIEALHLDPKISRILVVGCGSGELVLMLTSREFKVTAFDIDQETINIAQQTLGPFAARATLSVNTLENFPNDRSFDLVIATDVLEHIEDENASALKLQQLCRESGYMIITVPALQWLFGIHDEKLGHYRRYNKTDLGNLFSKNFEVKKLRYFGFLFVPMTYLVSRLLRRPYPLQHDKGSIRAIGRQVLRFIFSLEKMINTPLGTSVLMLAKMKSKN